MSFFTPIPFVSGPHPSHPLLVFAISTVIFSLAIQKRPGTGARQALAALHLVSAGLALSLPSTVLVPFNHVLAPAGLIITMHTAALLLIDKQVLSAGETWWSLLRAVYRIWANPRRLQLPTSSSSRRSSDATAATTGTFSRSTARWFALTRCTRAAALLVSEARHTHGLRDCSAVKSKGIGRLSLLFFLFFGSLASPEDLSYSCE
ncbi:hypothetical protein V8F33_014181 [Rhypophila sp. PSN 637]